MAASSQGLTLTFASAPPRRSLPQQLAGLDRELLVVGGALAPEALLEILLRGPAQKVGRTNASPPHATASSAIHWKSSTLLSECGRT